MKRLFITAAFVLIPCFSSAQANDMFLMNQSSTAVNIAADQSSQNQDAEKAAMGEKARQDAAEAEKRANEERNRLEKLEAEKKASEERARQEQAENERRAAEEERIRKERTEAEQREQEIRRQQELKEAERQAQEEKIRQEKSESEQREQGIKNQQAKEEAERKAFEERLRQEKIEANRKEQELKQRQEQLEAEKKEANRRNQIREEELKREREKIEAEKRRHEHNIRRHDYYDRDHHRHGNAYDGNTTIIYKEEKIYYSDPYENTYPPEKVYVVPENRPSTVPGYKVPVSEVDQDRRTAKEIIREILENEALAPDMEVSTANADFLRQFMKSLKTNDGKIIFVEPIVVTSDPSDPDLTRNIPCSKKTSGTDNQIKKIISLTGERKFRLYRLKIDKGKKPSEYEYFLYGEPLETTDRPDLFSGYSRIDSSACRIRRGITVNNEDSETGTFSTIINYGKQYYILDVTDSTTGDDSGSSHIIRLYAYSEDKKNFEQDPRALWMKSESIN